MSDFESPVPTSVPKFTAIEPTDTSLKLTNVNLMFSIKGQGF